MQGKTLPDMPTLEYINEEMNVKMEITGVFKDALSRQAEEAVRIFSRRPHELLNSKSEFNHPKIARVIVEKKNKYPKSGPRYYT